MSAIKTSLDWSAIEIELIRRANSSAYKYDLKKMIENIKNEISQLSRLEVEERRSKKHKTDKLVEKINEDISMVEEYILVSVLLGN